MTDRGRRVMIAASLAAVLAAASVPCAGADDAEGRSRKLFKEATELANGGQFAEACPKFQQAHDLHSTGGTALRTADCYEKIGQYEQALALYQYVVDHRDTDSQPERVKLAEGRVAALKKQLAPEPPPLPTATATAIATASAAPSVTAAPLPAATMSAVPIATAPPAETARTGRSKLMIASFATGGAGALIGGIFGGLALSKAADVKNNICGQVPRSCPEGKKDADAAMGMAWISNLGFTLAVAGAVTGVVLLATRSSPKAQQALERTLGPDGVTFRF